MIRRTTIHHTPATAAMAIIAALLLLLMGAAPGVDAVTGTMPNRTFTMLATQADIDEVPLTYASIATIRLVDESDIVTPDVASAHNLTVAPLPTARGLGLPELLGNGSLYSGSWVVDPAIGRHVLESNVSQLQIRPRWMLQSWRNVTVFGPAHILRHLQLRLIVTTYRYRVTTSAALVAWVDRVGACNASEGWQPAFFTSAYEEITLGKAMLLASTAIVWSGLDTEPAAGNAWCWTKHPLYEPRLCGKALTTAWLDVSFGNFSTPGVTNFECQRRLDVDCRGISGVATLVKPYLAASLQDREEVRVRDGTILTSTATACSRYDDNVFSVMMVPTDGILSATRDLTRTETTLATGTSSRGTRTATSSRGTETPSATASGLTRSPSATHTAGSLSPTMSAPTTTASATPTIEFVTPTRSTKTGTASVEPPPTPSATGGTRTVTPSVATGTQSPTRGTLSPSPSQTASPSLRTASASRSASASQPTITLSHPTPSATWPTPTRSARTHTSTRSDATESESANSTESVHADSATPATSPTQDTASASESPELTATKLPVPSIPVLVNRTVAWAAPVDYRALLREAAAVSTAPATPAASSNPNRTAVLRGRRLLVTLRHGTPAKGTGFTAPENGGGDASDQFLRQRLLPAPTDDVDWALANAMELDRSGAIRRRGSRCFVECTTAGLAAASASGSSLQQLAVLRRACDYVAVNATVHEATGATDDATADLTTASATLLIPPPDPQTASQLFGNLAPEFQDGPSVQLDMQLSGGCFSTAMARPPELPPLTVTLQGPPRVVSAREEAAKEATETARTTVAVAGVAAGGGAVAAQVSRTAFALGLLACAPPREQMDWVQDPFQTPIGDPEPKSTTATGDGIVVEDDNAYVAYYAGPALFNLVFMGTVGLGQVAISFFVSTLNDWPLQYVFTFTKFPSVLAFVMLLLADPTTYGATVAVVHGAGHQRAVGVLSLLACLGLVVFIATRLREQKFMGTLVAYDDPDIDEVDQVTMNPVKRFIFGQLRWYDTVRMTRGQLERATKRRMEDFRAHCILSRIHRAKIAAYFGAKEREDRERMETALARCDGDVERARMLVRLEEAEVSGDAERRWQEHLQLIKRETLPSDDPSAPKKTIVSGDGYCKRSKMFFDEYTDRMHNFYVVEISMTLAIGVLEGVKLGSGKCAGVGITFMLLMLIYLGFVLAIRPHISWYETIFNVGATALQCASSVAFVVGWYTETPAAFETSSLLVTVGMYMLIAKVALDTARVIFKLSIRYIAGRNRQRLKDRTDAARKLMAADEHAHAEGQLTPQAVPLLEVMHQEEEEHANTDKPALPPPPPGSSEGQPSPCATTPSTPQSNTNKWAELLGPSGPQQHQPLTAAFGAEHNHRQDDDSSLSSSSSSTTSSSTTAAADEHHELDALSPSPRRGPDGTLIRNEAFDYAQLLPPAPVGLASHAGDVSGAGRMVADPPSGAAFHAAVTSLAGASSSRSGGVGGRRSREERDADLLERVLAASDADEADRIVRMALL